MSVDLTVIANSSAVDHLDYRTFASRQKRVGLDDESKWVRADKDGNQSIVQAAVQSQDPPGKIPELLLSCH